MSINPRYIINSKGKQTDVVLSIKEFDKLIEAYEDLEDIVAYHKAKASGGDTISWEQMKEELRKLGKID
jgi:hypothetical protein